MSLALLLTFAGCGPSAEAVTQAGERARLVAGELQAQLLAELTAALTAEAVPQAVEVFADVALPITSKLADGVAVDLRRVALRVRNPLNAPDDYERAWLEQTRERHDGDRSVVPVARSEVLPAPGGGYELRYLEPLLAVPLCTPCHGPRQQIASEVLAAIRRRYPDDQAVDFAPGELLGAVSVRVPLP